MAEFFDEQGNKVEAYTPEEIEAKLEEERLAAIEEANAAREEEINNLVQQLEEKEAALQQLQEALAKEQNKEKNLGAQRKIIENKENEIESLKKELEALKQESQTKFTELEQKTKENTVNAYLDKISNGDKDLKAKIKFFYDNFKGEPQNEQEIAERVKNAYILATGGQSSIRIAGDVISSASGTPQPKLEIPEGKINPDLIPLAHQMGITDQDLKKYHLI